MYLNNKVKTVYLPNIKYIYGCFFGVSEIETAILSNLISINFPQDFKITKYLYAPKLEKVSDISLLKDIPYCYTPLLEEYCNTEDLIFDYEQLSLEENDNLNKKSR